MKEERRSNRVPKRREAVLCIAKERSFPIITWDISLTGLSASIQTAIPVGTRCTIQFTDDTEKTLFEAIIARTAPNKIGISFQNLTSEQRALLKTYL